MVSSPSRSCTDAGPSVTNSTSVPSESRSSRNNTGFRTTLVPNARRFRRRTSEKLQLSRNNKKESFWQKLRGSFLRKQRGLKCNRSRTSVMSLRANSRSRDTTSERIWDSRKEHWTSKRRNCPMISWTNKRVRLINVTSSSPVELHIRELEVRVRLGHQDGLMPMLRSLPATTKCT